jgi:ATP-dependent Clp protease protease subunit
MNCEGGCVTNGFAMYDAIKACQNQVEIKVIGCAQSMATVVLQAADKRVMSPNARMMIHLGSQSIAEDHAKNVENLIKEGKELDRIASDIYLEKIQEVQPDFKMSRLNKMLDFDTFLSAQTALEMGLIDEIDED